MKPIWWPFLSVLATLFFNEFLVYYLVIIWNCRWPTYDADSLRVFMIADTHLLGKYRGHWLDKLKREWQMYRSYHSAVTLLDPDAVFFLGDLMDEGKWTDRAQFDLYSDRFNSLFSPDSERPIVRTLAGNHDLGFHYEVSPIRMEWFSQRFRTKTIDTVTLRGHPFVMMTSMALHGDGCSFCSQAEQDLQSLSELLECASDVNCSKPVADQFRPFSKPIILQHYPLYRENDSVCERDRFFDWTDKTRGESFRPLWDCLGEESTQKLLKWINPRTAFAGHTHRGCTRKYPTFTEYTVNSFSWRNGPNPSMLLVTIDSADVTVHTCWLPNENFLIALYVISIGFALLFYGYKLHNNVRAWYRPPEYRVTSVKIE